MDVVNWYSEDSQPLVLIVMQNDQGHALVWTRVEPDGGLVPVEVVLRGGPPPSDEECITELVYYEPPQEGAVSTSMLRSLSLSDALNSVTSSALQPDQFHSRVNHAEVDLVESAYDRFRSKRDRDAAIEWVSVSAAFLARVQQGDPSPVQSLARDLGKTVAWVNKRLASARQAGYLTSFGHGRAGGNLTDEAVALLRRAIQEEEHAASHAVVGESGEVVRPADSRIKEAGRVQMCMWCMEPSLFDGQDPDCPHCGQTLF